jgi:hypothetical protein
MMALVQLSPLLAAAGGPPPPANSGLMAKILAELARSQAAEFISALILWTTLGVFLGLLLALALSFAFRALGWYRSDWRYAQWACWSVVAVNLALGGFFFGSLGFLEGTRRGSEVVLTKSQIGTDLLPKIGDAVASGLGWLQVFSTQSNELAQAEGGVLEGMAAFQAGKWELDAARVEQQMDALTAATISNVVVYVEKTAAEQAPQLQDGLGKELFRQVLNAFTAALVPERIDGELKRLGATRIYRAIRENLVVEAARQGNPATISHRELSTFVVNEGVLPAILNPLRAFVRLQQAILLGLAVLALILPSAVYWGVNWLSRKWKTPAPPQSPDHVD